MNRLKSAYYRLLLCVLFVLYSNVFLYATETGLCGTIESTQSDSYPMQAASYLDVMNTNVASASKTLTTLPYSSQIFTTDQLVIFSYYDDTQLEVYDSTGTPVSFSPSILDKGGHVFVDTSEGFYTVAGSNKYAVLTGDAIREGISGYYAIDADGRGVSNEFYTYVPESRITGGEKFIIFAYEDGTTITVQEETSSGYVDVAFPVQLDEGEHWEITSLSGKYLHIIADKHVSALTCYDQAYFVPTPDGAWCGRKFYTYVPRPTDYSNYWPQDLSVIAYEDDTYISIADSISQESIYEGYLGSGEAYVEKYPSGADKYITVTADKDVSVSVQTWKSVTELYYNAVFIPDKTGSGIGTDFIGSTLNSAWGSDDYAHARLYVIAFEDDTHIELYDSQANILQSECTLNAGKFEDINPGNGLWRVKSDRVIAVYSVCGNRCSANFAPLVFNKSTNILDVKDYHDALFSGANGGTLFDLLLTDGLGGYVSGSTEDLNAPDNIWALEVYNNDDGYGDNNLYMGIGSGLYNPTVTVDTDAETVDVADLGSPVFSAASGEVISLKAANPISNENSVLFIGSGFEATANNNYDASQDKVNIYVGKQGTNLLDVPLDEINAGIQTSGVQCFLETAGEKTKPDNITLSIATEIEQGTDGIYGNPDGNKVNPTDSAYNGIQYTINYDPTGNSTAAENMIITVDLPDSAVFVSSIGNGGYDENSHRFICAPSSTATEQIIIEMVLDEQKSIPGESLEVICWAENAGYSLPAEDLNGSVEVDCWSGDVSGVVFVDGNNDSGHENGTSWETAFRTIEDALNHVKNSGCSYTQVWVAEGDYWTDGGIHLPSGISIYGGFEGDESSLSDRDLSNLQGQTTQLNGGVNCDYVVIGESNTTFDGFTVWRGNVAGILCEDASTTILHCQIMNSYGDGIRVIGESAPIIRNNWIYNNIDNGIYIDSTSAAAADIQSNTIVNNGNNEGYGIYSIGTAPTINNCILWGNKSGAHNSLTATYCYTASTDPEFQNMQGNDYRLTSNSPANIINSGDPDYDDSGQTDILGKTRIVNGRIDIGAHELPEIKVDAGSDIETTMTSDPYEVKIDATVTYNMQGSPPAGLYMEWTPVSGPASAVIVNAEAVDATIRFTEYGDYTFKLTAYTDSDKLVLINEDTVRIRVHLGIVPSSSKTSVTLPENEFDLTASYLGGTPFEIEWFAWNAPEGVSFDGSGNNQSGRIAPDAVTSVTVPNQSGRYVFWVIAYDSLGHFMGDGYLVMPVNYQQLDITIEADSDEITWPDNTVNLTATFDGGVPDSIKWIPPTDEITSSSSALVSFSADDSYQTLATFDERGTYEIGLEAKDSDGYTIGFATIEITVNPPAYNSVVVDAGQDQDIEWPQNFAYLHGEIVNGELGVGYTSVQWVGPIKIDGTPVALTFNPDNSLDTKVVFDSASFPGNGSYEFALYAFKEGDPNPVGVGNVTINVTGYTGGNTYTPINIELSSSPADVHLDINGEAVVDLTGSIDSGGLHDPTKTEWVCYSDPASYSFDPAPTVGTSTPSITFKTNGPHGIGLIVKNSLNQILFTATTTIDVKSYQSSDTTVSIEAKRPQDQFPIVGDIELKLFSDDILELTSYLDSLNFDWAAWSESTGNVTFSDITYPGGLDPQPFSTATAQFNKIGTYTLKFEAKSDGANGTIVGSHSITVEVANPTGLVTALAGPRDAGDLDDLTKGPYGVVYTNEPIEIYLGGALEFGGVNNYAWGFSCTKLVSVEDPLIDLSDWAPFGAKATIFGPGEYTFTLDTGIDSDDVTVFVLSGEPQVSAGTNSDYPAVATTGSGGAGLWLNQAYIVDDTYVDPAESNDKIQWSYEHADGSVHFDRSASSIKPIVTFDNPGTYAITVSYSDGVFPTVTSQPVCIQIYDAPEIDAGLPKSTVPFVPVQLDGDVNPDYVNNPFDPKWTIVSGASAQDVMFSPSNREMDPTFTYLKPVTGNPVTIELMLEDYNGDPPYTESDTVEVTVYPAPINDPPTIDTAMINTVDFVPGLDLDISDYVAVVVEASDESMANIYLELDGVMLSQDKFLRYDMEVLQGMPEAPQKLGLSCTLDAHSLTSGVHTLKAYAVDSSGSMASSETTFDNICMITDYHVTPDVIDSPTGTIDFHAQMAADFTGQWTLEVIGTSYSQNNTISTVDIRNINLSMLGLASDGTSNGSYEAKLTAHDSGDVASVYFNVAIGLSSNDLVALITNDLKVDYSTNADGIPEDSLYVIENNKFELYGQAYHLVYPDVTVNNNTVTSEVYYKVEISNSEGTTNVTSGPLDSLGFKNQSVGPDEDVLASLDLSALENGIYTLKLTVKCKGYTKTDSVDVVLNCPLKLGQVKFSQEDLSINVGGYPIQVIRSYDSFERQKTGDFGCGWTYSLSNLDIDLHETRIIDGDHTRRMGPIYDRNVTLTLPNGQRVTFNSYYESAHHYYLSYSWPENLGIKSFYIEGDTDSVITSISDLFNSCIYWMDFDINEYIPYYSQYEDESLSSYDVPGYALKLENGAVYHVRRIPYGRKERRGLVYDSRTGLTFEDLIYDYYPYGKPYLASIDLPTGEIIVFEVDKDCEGFEENPIIKSIWQFPASVHDNVTNIDDLKSDPSSYSTYGSKAIEILYDDDNRVTAIYPPSELIAGEIHSASVPYVRYHYDDGQGNLTSVDKLKTKGADEGNSEYETTDYEYENGIYHPYQHYVTAIKDPRGLSPIRYLYDDNGKLIGTMDAKGNVIEISHALKDSSHSLFPDCTYEEIKDRNDNITQYFYDDRGNVVGVIKHDGQGGTETTTYTYDDTTNPDKPTSVTRTVPDKDDPVGNPPVDSVTYTAYDTNGYPRVSWDPMLNVTTTIYDAEGKLLETTQWEPIVMVTQNDFPSDYPDTQPDPAEYKEVTTTVNKYDSTAGLMIFTGTRNGSGASEKWYSVSLTYYAPDNQIQLSVQVNADNIGPAQTLFDDLFTDGNYNQLKDFATLQGMSLEMMSTVYEYNGLLSGSPDQPYSVTGPSGQTQYFKYDANNRQIESWTEWQDPYDANRKIHHVNRNQYDGQGRIVTTIWEEIEFTSMDGGYTWDTGTVINTAVLSETEYNSVGKVDYTISQHETDDSGTMTIYDYDEAGNQVETRTYQFVDGIGDYVELTVSQTLYDAEGRTIVTVGPYDPLDTAAKPQGTETVYDAMGRVVETRQWKNVELQLKAFKVDSRGELVFEGSAAYDSLPDPYVGKTIDPDITVDNAWDANGTAPTSIGWTSEGSLPQEGNEKSRTETEYLYGMTYRTNTMQEDGSMVCTSEYRYDQAGRQVTTITLPDDTAGRRAQTKTEYKGTRRFKSIDAEQKETIYTYDGAGRLTETQYPATDNVTGFDNTGAVTTATPEATFAYTGYDGFGRKTWETINRTTATYETVETNPNTMAKQFDYDSVGRLITVTLPIPEYGMTNPLYNYFYDDYGNMIGILDPEGMLTVFTYNNKGQQVDKYMPFTPVWQAPYDTFLPSDPYNGIDAEYILDINYTVMQSNIDYEHTDYDSQGRVSQVIDYKGQTTVYNYYDESDCMDTGGSAVVFNGLVDSLKSRDFYAAGAVDPTERYKYFYDPLGRKVSEEVYDIVGGVETNPRIWTYEYDPQTGALKTLIPAEGPAINYDYHDVSEQKQFTRTAETTVSYVYDELGRMSDVTALLPQEQSVSSVYDYTLRGSRNSVTLPNDVYTEYEYNDLNALTRLTHWKNNSMDTDERVSEFEYKHYASGMRAYVHEHLNEERYIGYTYDALNRLIVEKSYNAAGLDMVSSSSYGYTTNYEYDLRGNRAHRTVVADNAYGTCTLETQYNYYTDHPDRLHTEVQSASGVCAAIPLGDDQYAYAYTHPGGGITYKLPDRDEHIGQFMAMLYGLPSIWNTVLFYVLILVIPVAFFWPVFVRQWSRIRGCIDPMASPDLRLWHRMLCVLFSYIFLVGPEAFQITSQASIQYDNLSTATWGKNGQTITYGYDANGSMTSKVTNDGTYDTESVIYEYNMQNRLYKVTTTPYIGGVAQDPTITQYWYSPSGIRYKSQSYNTVDGYQTTLYTIDPSNHTGYAQVLEERTYNMQSPVYGSNTPASVRYYTIGDDVLSQADNGSETNPQYLLYDGQGSTRQLLDHTYAVEEVVTGKFRPIPVDSYSYDGYGVMLSDGVSGAEAASGADTSLLYTGEQYDGAADQYYLRARYYNPLNGIFNRIDPYAGNVQDPQSLHKYAYVHNNPVNNIDPTGMSITGVAVGVAIGAVITNIALTVYSGIRHKVSAKVMTWNIIQSLATFAVIAGAILLSGPIAIAAGITLLLSAGWGLYNLITQWKNMDGIDKVIVFAQILTYLVFAGAIKVYASASTGSGGNGEPLDWQKVVKQSGKNKGETRMQHVRKHNANNLSKPKHGVFNGDGVEIINEAWNLRGNTKPTTQGSVDIYHIRYPKAGWEGGSMGSGQTLNGVNILTETGTNNIITGYPANP